MGVDGSIQYARREAGLRSDVCSVDGRNQRTIAENGHCSLDVLGIAAGNLHVAGAMRDVSGLKSASGLLPVPWTPT